MTRRTPALLAAFLVLAACAETTGPAPVPIGAEVARLSALGFRAQGTTAEGTQILRYAGPVTAAVACRSGTGATFHTPPAQRVRGDGARQRLELDAYLMLTPGPDGMLSPRERDGLYVVTIATRLRGRTTTESIAFGPGESGSFRSGMTCRPT
ncbi:pyruvate/2-oxoglutarate dehydrogenase complex [Cereibacter sphaeroides]|uniref:pyruvate/2-oxoglutarate dehydrogenase complex n=1 Tax=Cereibacter sphaeroides TaxID=1063 RepID=UPI000F5240EF|nr:pyruvate/2-oxoglutarate dehydrogenase complex [Cereibacter sphaeroides]AZB57432.1 pyruvate/2-oxoglutarate dehydrogenase complex [Cereibacter sphaeroides]AZB61686.1 pyruvate/2-oxoglutarate dehydrogenase complex [Cereibacter sphaeroides]